jgi:hypothetical protein
MNSPAENYHSDPLIANDVEMIALESQTVPNNQLSTHNTGAPATQPSMPIPRSSGVIDWSKLKIQP